MQCLKRFNKKMSLSGGSLREESIFNTRELLKETFADDPSFVSGIYFWRLGLKDYKHESQIGIRLYGRSFSAANGVTVKFQTLYDTPVIVGDVIYDINRDEYLICTEAFDIDSINHKGKFTLCNWILKWQNKNGEILEYPCYDMNSTQYNSGEQSNTHFTIGSSQHMITLPSDENTIALSSPQRFYLDKNMDNPTSFIVTQNDTTSHNYGRKGLVKLTVYEYPNNEKTDRPDIGICDYIEINDKHDIKDVCSCGVAKVIIEHSTSVIKSGGDLQTFTAKFYDENGNEIKDIVPHWNIISDSLILPDLPDKLQVKKGDNCISIGIDDDLYIDEEFKIICSNGDKENEIVSDALTITIESLL